MDREPEPTAIPIPVPQLSECSERKFQYDSVNERCTNDGDEINEIYGELRFMNYDILNVINTYILQT